MLFSFNENVLKFVKIQDYFNHELLGCTASVFHMNPTSVMRYRTDIFFLLYVPITLKKAPPLVVFI